MQTSGAEAVDPDAESQQTREMYGLQTMLTGRKCLITRRLIEREGGGASVPAAMPRTPDSHSVFAACTLPVSLAFTAAGRPCPN